MYDSDKKTCLAPMRTHYQNQKFIKPVKTWYITKITWINLNNNNIKAAFIKLKIWFELDFSVCYEHSIINNCLSVLLIDFRYEWVITELLWL